MEKKGKDYLIDIYIDDSAIGFDITPEMADYENVVAIDVANKETTSDTLSVNIQGEYLKKVVENMGSDRIHVLNVFVYLYKSTVKKIAYDGRMNGKMVRLSKVDQYYYGHNDISGYGNALYADSWYYPDSKPIERSVRIEIRTYKRADGSNWTIACTQPQY